MSDIHSYHSSRGGCDFLGLRLARTGCVEIVYDDGVARRMVWRVATPGVDPARLGPALRAAVDNLRVVPALHAELKKRAISIEAVIR